MKITATLAVMTCIGAGASSAWAAPSASVMHDSSASLQHMTVADLETGLAGSSAQQDAAVQYIVEHPDAAPPVDYLGVIKRLLDRGDSAQAAFWYYVWQIRIAAWNLAAPAQYSELVGAISATMGEAVNEWAGSDLLDMRDLMARASTFERRVPLYPGRPDGVSEADWRHFVETSRTGHSLEVLEKAFPTSSTALERAAETRRRNGLYVGPWQSPGKPIPDEWR